MNLRSSSAPRRKVFGRLGALGIGAAVIAASVAGGVVSAQAATTNIATGPIDILLGVGADQTQRIVSWYFPTNVNQALEIEKTSDLNAGAFDTDKKVVVATKATNGASDVSTTDYPSRTSTYFTDDPGTPTTDETLRRKGYPGYDAGSNTATGASNQSGYINAHATVTGLLPGTTYSYHVGAADGTNWSTTYQFTTPGTSNNFDFLFFGDPQVGSSGGPVLDGDGWAKTLQYATTNDPSAELLVSGGDQIEHANDEFEWSEFADSSNVLKQYPWAATIGNHDFGGKAYEQHNLVPNNSKWSTLYQSGSSTGTDSGGDYWFIYKDVLFIDLNSNAYAGAADAEHVSYVTDVINRYGSLAKYKVLVYHHSIYSPADHANDIDNQQRRADFTTAFSKLGVNLVLQGHDHSYSRSYAILSGTKANPAEQPAAPEVFAGPGGVIYVTANSASGSKYYPLTAPDSTQGGYGPDSLDTLNGDANDTLRHWANSVEDQENVRTYVQVSVTDSGLTVKDIRAGDCSTDEVANPNAAADRGNVSTCGGTPGETSQIPYVQGATTQAAGVQPIGSLVDHFTLDTTAPASTTRLAVSKTSKVFGASTAIALNATVSGGIGGLSGSVGFYEGSKLLATKPLSSGKASYTLPVALTVGSHSYTAKFTSGSIFSAAGSASGAVKVTVAKATSTTKVGYAGGKVTVAVAASTAATVTGSVKVYDGSKLVKTVSLSKGKASFADKLKKGTHKLKAVYAGISTVSGSTSKVVTVKVTK